MALDFPELVVSISACSVSVGFAAPVCKTFVLVSLAQSHCPVRSSLYNRVQLRNAADFLLLASFFLDFPWFCAL